MKTETRQQVNNAISELRDLASTFTEEQLNTVPFEGSWTAGQLGKHIIMANGGFVEMLNGPVEQTDRAPDAWCEKLKTDFLNFSVKMDSPDFVRPKITHYKKEEILNELAAIQANLDRAVSTLDLTQTCTSFALPFYGHLTRLEAVHFVIYHTRRHIHQLKNIRQKVIGNQVLL